MVRATPAASSWGAGGYGAVWIGPESAKVWRHIHHASRYVTWLLDNYRGVRGTRGRALDLAIVQLLLLQSSDWGFIVTNQTVPAYAWGRFRAHVHRLRHLGYLVQKPSLEPADQSFIDELASRDNFLDGLAGEPLRSAFDGS
jgi:1,4-alpha-glucan branching enzyme